MFDFRKVVLFGIFLLAMTVCSDAYACKSNDPNCPSTAPGIKDDGVDGNINKLRRKVTTLEYDYRGNLVKSKVYDDVGPDATLLSQIERKYDALRNIILERQIMVETDVTQVNDFKSHIAQSEGDNRYMIEKRYAYEDSTWPTKVTAEYQPRYANRDLTYQDRMAERYFYDQTTGVLELKYSSNYYCIDLNANINSKTKAGSFNVEQSGQSQTVEILPYNRCSVSAVTKLDRFARPEIILTSQALANVSNLNPKVAARTWLESHIEYYTATSRQKSAIKSATTISLDPTLNRKTTYDYTDMGDLKSVTTNNGGILSAEYDLRRRLTKSSRAEGEEAIYAYNSAGRLRSVSRKINNNEWAVLEGKYYANGLLRSITDPDGDVTLYTYDDGNRPDVVIDGAGRQTKNIYYPNGQTKCMIKGYGSDLVQAYAMYEYGADGQVIAQRPAKGITLIGGSNPTDCEVKTKEYDTYYRYDEYRRLFETNFPKRDQDIGKTNPRTGETYSYVDGAWEGRTYTRQWLDPNGNNYLTRTRFGDVLEQVFDVSGMVAERITPENRYVFAHYGRGAQYYADIRPRDESVPDSASLANKYPLSGRRYVAMPYSDLGELLYELSRFGYGATKSSFIPRTMPFYDEVGNIRGLKYYSGAGAFYEYDKSNRLISTLFSADGTEENKKSVNKATYDQLGRMMDSLIGLNSHQTGGGDVKQSYSFDADRDLKRISSAYLSASSGNEFTLDLSFEHDASGKITAKYAGFAIWRNTPNENTEDYGYANTLDQYNSVDLGDGNGPQDFTYDGNGNLISDGTGRSYKYNSENQMIRATGTAAGNIFDMEYLYDSLGRRSHSIDHANGNEIFHKHYGQMEIEDFTLTRDGSVVGEGKVTQYQAVFRNIIGSGVDQRLAYHDVSGDELFFPMTDHQGSTIAMVDEDGELLSHADGGRFVYGPYGENANNVPDGGYPYRYTGRRFDAQTGLYYYRARYYDTRTGRFLQTDPIGYADQMNLYAYVGNDPMNASDPSGMQTNSSSAAPAPTSPLNPVQNPPPVNPWSPNTTPQGSPPKPANDAVPIANPLGIIGLGVLALPDEFGDEIDQDAEEHKSLRTWVRASRKAIQEGDNEIGIVAFHGTNLTTATHLAGGGRLTQVSNEISLGDGAFYMTTSQEFAQAFAISKMQNTGDSGAIVFYVFSPDATTALLASGTRAYPDQVSIGRYGSAQGVSIRVPSQAFPTFNSLQEAGEIKSGMAQIFK